jgi:hypothetical protein
MTTELTRFSAAYATMVVAAYEPLILRWISSYSIMTLVDSASKRGYVPAALAEQPTAMLAAYAGKAAALRMAGESLEEKAGPSAEEAEVLRRLEIGEKPTRIDLAGYPRAELFAGKIFPEGFDLSRYGGSVDKVPLPEARSAVPVLINKTAGFAPVGDISAVKKEMLPALLNAAKDWTKDPNPKRTLAEMMSASVQMGATAILPFFWPTGIIIEEALSPIGIAHYFRQLYFNAEEGVGPIEEAFTIAPLETLEVIYETVRKQIHEEQLELGQEVISESATEEKNLEEVSDKVSSMIQRDASASMSASGSGSIGVWQVGASASASMGVSTQRSREETSRRLKEITVRASERITKSFTIKTRDLDEFSSRNLTRRVIKNDGAAPVSYGLRRVLRRVKVKVQQLGPKLVWQLYLRNPGAGLAQSRFVHFREAASIATPEIPPGMRERPVGGTDTGTTSSQLRWDDTRRTFYVTLVISPGADRVVKAVSIDSVTDLEGGGKGDLAPSPKNNVQWGSVWDDTAKTFTVNIGVLEGDAASVSLTYTYAWDPAQRILDEWEAERRAAVAAIDEDKLQKQFEREKALINEKSKIRKRPANDLRREERYEVMSRLVSQLLKRGAAGADPTPLEIETFHRYFEIEGMFITVHPAWWRPRYTPVATGFSRESYAITNESEPAPMGASLGWLLQLDGDTRRNEFLNSPWARVCLPIQPGREREAISWLAAHVEGTVGYDPGKAPLKDLLKAIEDQRTAEGNLGLNGPEYVTVESSPGAPAAPATPEGVYPVVDEFEITVPTDGFVYEELKIQGA